MENEVINKNNRKGKILLLTDIILVIGVLALRRTDSIIPVILLILLAASSVYSFYTTKKMDKSFARGILRILSIILMAYSALFIIGVVFAGGIGLICKTGGGC